MDTIKVEICAPERDPLRFEAKRVVLPGAEGVFTVLPGHTTLLSKLATGPMALETKDGQEMFFALNGGFTEINQNRVLVLTQTAETAEEIDAARAEAAKERAEKRLHERDRDFDLFRAEAALERALARLMAESRQGV
ncbi:MAG: F0F1 ATP synthase subunit epsilon [bacterium]|nr:F0F1 ATP synthase subunit epsilon [bacterium]